MTPQLLSTPEPAPGTTRPRRRLFDNPKLIGLLVFVLVAVLGFLFWAATHTEQLGPEVIADVVVYAISPVILTLVLALVAVLGRNIVKLWGARRDALPFARFRARLVAALLAMTILPAALVLVIGSELITSSAQRWFSTPADELVAAAHTIGQALYKDRADIARARATRLATALPLEAVVAADAAALQQVLTTELSSTSTGMAEVYRVSSNPGFAPDAVFIASVGESSMPRSHAQASADRLAARVALSGRAENIDDNIDDGVLIRAAAPLRNGAGAVVGVVVATEAMSGQINSQARMMDEAYKQYQQLKVLRGPLQGFYLSLFLAVTLLILISATWFGLFVAKRITRPVQMLAEGTRAVGAGQLDLRIEPDSTDELGSLVESFNSMAADLRTSHERLDARRRYIETILERVATGVVSLTADGKVSTVNGAAQRLLGLEPGDLGQLATRVFGRNDLLPLLPIITATAEGKPAGLVEEITLARDEREVHLAVAATVLVADGGKSEGAVVVLDDVTPLIRAQRVAAWRDVARRLAHEIKNPLTPIQLSAERLQRNFATAPPNARALVEECTGAIITEVEALKGLVDEFAQFARMRGPKLVPSDLNGLAADTVRLYHGVLQQGSVELAHALEPHLPRVRMDPEQMRQVVINLVDNAIDALGGAAASVRDDGSRPRVLVATSHDAGSGVVRLCISDNGPGIPAADRDKLFMPYYSTKGRGSGLGLAIVRRIITEHGGTVEVDGVEPHGAVFTVDLPTA